ncbi:SDR family NAD(P)-dependent oxidoreductase [Nonomuraea jabiensis]|uniref:SDR family NAD(P)-dependent oxidoreductase n=1 Tax=Nonomuraea jabiensis TaxID=882448 RepID=UPI00368F2901
MTFDQKQGQNMHEAVKSDSSVTRNTWALGLPVRRAGIGRETALRLAEDGYSVVVCGRDSGRAAETRKLIESAGGRAVDLVADFNDPTAVRGLVAETREVSREQVLSRPPKQPSAC